jgi:pyridinium-3,5-bisthiocarboxylic acid mononucleotide nickel chelatase
MGHEGHEHDDHHATKHGSHGDHDHVHSAVAAPCEQLSSASELSRDCGRGKVLFFDAPSGLAGDMIVASLIDLGVPRAVVADALAALSISGFHVEFGTRVRSGIAATSFEVHIDARQPPRTYADVRAVLGESSRLNDLVKDRAQRIFAKLAWAEAKVHRMPLEDVHFHEVGSVDAIADVVGSAAALAHIGAELWVSPLPLGRGYVRAAHGILPLPSPATVDCLTGLSTYDGGKEFEFVTPTGAAIVGALAAGSMRWPSMTPERTGWGAGTAELDDRPNVMRAVLGSPISPARQDGLPSHTVVEANIDDATGELAASWIETLLALGALDAWVCPITMKKGRPAFTIAAMCSRERADVIAHAVLRETTSLGVRRYDVVRDERPRHIEAVTTPFGSIPVKVSRGPFGPPQIKPEFDACLQIARKLDVPVREVIRAAISSASALVK